MQAAVILFAAAAFAGCSPKIVEVSEPPAFFLVVEQPPVLVGGLEGLHARINYPEDARQQGIEGRVTVVFMVDEEGNVLDAQVAERLHDSCDQEALRVIRESTFEPGRQRGLAVKVRMSLPVTFRLPTSDR